MRAMLQNNLNYVNFTDLHLDLTHPARNLSEDQGQIAR